MTGCSFSIFLIERTLETVGAEQKPLCPRRCSRHLLTNGRERGALFAFDDQLVMNMGDDIHVPQRLNGIAENVTTDGLRDVFHEFRTVGFDSRPFLCRSQSHVGNRLTTELVLADARLCIGKPSAARKFDEHHAALADELDAVRDRLAALLDAFLCSSVDCPPEVHDVRICRAPCIYKRLQFIFFHAGLQCAEYLERTRGAAIAAVVD